MKPHYRGTGLAMVRATVHTDLQLPRWPDLTSGNVKEWQGWLRDVWALDAVAEAVEHVSPDLARRVTEICEGACVDPRRARRAVISMIRYVLRMTGRATPFGLFAGVATVGIGTGLSLHWGNEHRAVTTPSAAWISQVIMNLEARDELRRSLTVVANNLCFVRGDRLILPQPALTVDEIAVNHTDAVRLVMDAARTPIPYGMLAAKLKAEFPDVPVMTIDRTLTALLEQRILSALHAPSTVTDAFGYLMDQLVEMSRLTDLYGELQAIAEELKAAGTRRSRMALIDRMRALVPDVLRPLTVDLRLDYDLTLPREVVHEAERAASVLTRLSACPAGPPNWQAYHTRFFERYGIGSLVPVRDLTDPDIGLGFPAGYRGADPQPPGPPSDRDRRLLALVQQAMLDGLDEIILTDHLIDDLTAGELSPQGRLELCCRIQATSPAALESGDFTLAVTGVSRDAGAMTGRFAGLLDPTERAAITQPFANDELPVQLSFPPLDPASAHVARAPALLPTVLSLGEYPPAGPEVLTVDDLAVVSDGRRFSLVSSATGQRLTPHILHALDLRGHTPPLARFLAEIANAHDTVVTAFDWGIASCLPYLPRLRFGRTVLASARWLLAARELPDKAVVQWEAAFARWRATRRVPSRVLLTEGDRRLPLNLDEPAHLVVLREHLNRAGAAALQEAARPEAFGWFGGRVHEFVLPMAARPRPRPEIRATQLVRRGDGHLPGTSPWLYAKLYGHPARVHEILAQHLPRLLAEWDEQPLWWFIRYRDPGWHLRLRIALASPAEFGPAAARVTAWSQRLQQAGLLADMQYAAYRPETGRWGGGATMAAAERVFAADSHVIAALPVSSQALVAAGFVSIAAAFTGSGGAGARWLIEHAKTTGQTTCMPRTARSAVAEVARLAGSQPDARWEIRHQAVAAYRAAISAGTDDLDPDAVLVSLLHAHHIRAAGIDRDDERACLRLARAVALAHAARTEGNRR